MADDSIPTDQVFLDKARLSRRELEAIVASGVFDREFYLANYLDIAAARVNPLEHYLVTGRYEKRLANPLFDPAEYFELNPELQSCGIEPFQHYALVGKQAGRYGSRADVIVRILDT